MKSVPFPGLETERLILREICHADAPDLFAIHSDVEAMKWFGSDPIETIGQAEDLVEAFAAWRTQANPGTRWGLQLKNSGGLIGTCGLFRWNRNWSSCVIGYELASDAWGNGFMLEALNTIIPWGLSEMNLNRIEAQIHPDNLASIRLAERLGFVAEGCLRQAGRWLGEYHDLLQYSLLTSDWGQDAGATQQHAVRDV